MVGELIEPKRDQILRFCALDPVERVFLEDVARRGLGRFVAHGQDGELSALCHLGINAVPSGEGCGAFARDVARSGPRMLIGESRAVSELWDEVHGAATRAARRPARAARLRHPRRAARCGHRLCGRRS